MLVFPVTQAIAAQKVQRVTTATRAPLWTCAQMAGVWEPHWIVMTTTRVQVIIVSQGPAASRHPLMGTYATTKTLAL